MQALSWYTMKYLVFSSCEYREDTGDLWVIRLSRTDHVQGQIFVQIQMEAIVFIFLQIFFVARGIFSKLGNHSVIPQFFFKLISFEIGVKVESIEKENCKYFNVIGYWLAAKNEI